MEEIQLESERLVLRWFRESDFDSYRVMCRDPEVMRFIGGKPMSDIEVFRQMCAFMGHWHFRGYGMWAVEEKATGRLVGRIGFINPIGWPGFELGWTLARDVWGKGYATEGARRALQHGLTEMGRDHVISLIDPNNIASIKVAERLGEKVEGNTELFDKNVLVYGISRAEWEARGNV